MSNPAPPTVSSRKPGVKRECLVDLSIDAEQHDGLVRSVLAEVRDINRQDAEDAVQEAWLVLSAKADQLKPGPIGGYLRRTARFKALKIRDTRRRMTSLDELTELGGDAIEVLAGPDLISLDSHVALAELADDPIAREALDAARKGASAQVAPRGMNHQCARYTDEQVARVRELRAGGLVYTRIAELTGVPAGYCAYLARRGARLAGTTEGWTRPKVLDAIRRFNQRHQRAPRYRDLEREPTMPSPQTTRKLFGTFQDAVRAAGATPAYEGRRISRWTVEEMVQAFCAWRLRRKRWPNRADMVEDPGLPSPATTRRHFGTENPDRLSQAVLGLLA